MTLALRNSLIALVMVVGCKGSSDTAQPAPRSPYAPPTGPCEVDASPTDLTTLLDRQECQRTGGAKSIDPSSVVVSLSPAPLDLGAGERGKVTVTIANATEGPLDLDFDLSCDPWRGFTLVASKDDDEKRYAFAEGVLEGERWQVFTVEPEACAKYPVRVTVPPSGKVFLPIDFDPSMEWENRNLRLVHEGPFAAGQYVLRSEIPLIADAPVIAEGVLRMK